MNSTCSPSIYKFLFSADSGHDVVVIAKLLPQHSYSVGFSEVMRSALKVSIGLRLVCILYKTSLNNSYA